VKGEIILYCDEKREFEELIVWMSENGVDGSVLQFLQVFFFRAYALRNRICASLALHTKRKKEKKK
jgi:hypothetical protein